jgi:hypothetical protein
MIGGDLIWWLRLLLISRLSIGASLFVDVDSIWCFLVNVILGFVVWVMR